MYGATDVAYWRRSYYGEHPIHSKKGASIKSVSTNPHVPHGLYIPSFVAVVNSTVDSFANYGLRTWDLEVSGDNSVVA